MRSKELYNIESLYVYGTYGDVRLWGDGPSIAESKQWLAFGWGFDPADETHNYHWQEWWEKDGIEERECFLQAWKSARQHAINSYRFISQTP